MLKRGDIIRSINTGRYEVVIGLKGSSLPDCFYLVTAKVRKDGVSWGDYETHLVTHNNHIPAGYVVVPKGNEPETLRIWRTG